MTENHQYNTPSEGATDWHEPLNENFEALDADIEIRDTAANLGEYEPEPGAKFLELDTGIVYLGDGDSWVPALAMAYFDEQGELVCGELTDCGTDGPDDGTEAPSEFGRSAVSMHGGAIVFGDSTTRSIYSKGPDEVRSQMPIYAPAFNTTSASTAKTTIESVDPEQVLEDVESLAVTTWELTDTDNGRHMGPMAEEFAETFELGDADDTIATVDADGVALAAIQGLAERLREENERLREELAETADRLDKLEAENDTLRERVKALESTVH